MKGKPALRTALVLMLLVTVAYPVSRVISYGEHPAPTSTATVPPKSAAINGTLHIRTAPAPLRIQVTSSGKVLFDDTEANNLSEVSKEISLPSGSDLVVRAEWSDDRPHALHAEFLPYGTNTPIAHDYWSGRTLEDVLSLP